MQAPLGVRHWSPAADLNVPACAQPLAGSLPDSQVGRHPLTRQHNEHLNPIGSLLSALLPSQTCQVLVCSQWPGWLRQCSATSFDRGSRERVVRNFRLGRSDVLPCFLVNPQRYSVSRPCCTRGRRPVRPVLRDQHRQNSPLPSSSWKPCCGSPGRSNTSALRALLQDTDCSTDYGNGNPKTQDLDKIRVVVVSEDFRNFPKGCIDRVETVDRSLSARPRRPTTAMNPPQAAISRSLGSATRPLTLAWTGTTPCQMLDLRLISPCPPLGESASGL